MEPTQFLFDEDERGLHLLDPDVASFELRVDLHRERRQHVHARRQKLIVQNVNNRINVVAPKSCNLVES